MQLDLGRIEAVNDPKTAPTPGPIPPKPAAPGGPGAPAGRRPPGPGPTVINVLPAAAKASRKPRHRGLLLSFMLAVLVPLLLETLYLGVIAEDQYASTTAFSVRKEEGASASDFMGGLAQFAGISGSSDSDILYEFIQSQEIVERIDADMNLRAHYSQHWSTDKIFGLDPDASIEDVVDYWSRIVRISYDQQTGLMELRVLAYDADFARRLASAIVTESQKMINALSDAAQSDATRYAEADLEESVKRLKIAREALADFRTRTQIVDPEADIQGRMGVLNNLQQQLAEALIDSDMLRDTTRPDDPRMVQADQRIRVIRERILRERENFTLNDGTRSEGTEDYPRLMTEFESLTVDREFAEQTYRAALVALDSARANAERQSRYLATFVQPTLAQEAEYPRRWMIFGLSFLFLTLGWGIMALVYYSIRDRR